MTMILPILVEQGFNMLLGMVNSVMASHIGTEAVSAIGMVDTLNMTMFAFFSAVAVGATIVVSYYVARDDGLNASETVKQALYSSTAIAVVVSLIIVIFSNGLLRGLYGAAEEEVLSNAGVYLFWSSLSYPLIALNAVSNGVLRGSGDSKTPMRITIIMNIVNVCVGYVLIYGVELGSVRVGGIGIAGAGLAILSARAVGAALSLFSLLKGTRKLHLIDPFRYRPNLPILKSILNIGVPTGMDNLLFNMGKIIVQIFVVSCGTAAIAANYYTMSMSNLINLPGNAVSLATAALVGQQMGSGSVKGAKNMMFNLTTMTMAVMAVMCAIIASIAPHIVRIYNPAPDVFDLTVNYLYMTCIATPLFWPIAFLLPNGLRSVGDARHCMVISVASMWVVRIGLGYMLCMHTPLGIYGVWLAMFSDWIARGGFFVARYISGKWRGHQVLFDENAEGAQNHA